MAADKLFDMRPEFVKNVSESTLKELVDALLRDRVLNDGEKYSILKKHETNSDNARTLVDIVRPKGDGSSSKMIAHLEKIDSELHSELGLPRSQPPQPPQPRQSAAQVNMETEWSSTLLPATDGFWNEKQKDPHVYLVEKKSIQNRVALLITNITFTHLSYRHGAERDEKNMEKLLSDLKYEVVKCRNLTAQEINTALIQFSRHEKLRETDSVVVVIMSHGKRDAVFGVNCENEMSADVFPIDNIYEHLGSEECPALVNKPKIIIIQACRGGHEGPVKLVSDSANQVLVCDDASQPGAEGEMEEDAGQIVHREKDFFSLLSSTPGTMSYRDPVFGSVLIQYIVQVFNTLACKDHIDELFTTVMRRVSKHPNIKQVPTKDRCSAINHFYFFPGY